MTEEQEEALFDAQYEEIKKECGEKAANQANIGWGHSEGSIASKVYGHGVLLCTYDEETGEIHSFDWEYFD